MAEASDRPGPELSAAGDAREAPAGLEPGFPKRPRRPVQQTPPSRIEDDGPQALDIYPPAHNDGS